MIIEREVLEDNRVSYLLRGLEYFPTLRICDISPLYTDDTIVVRQSRYAGRDCLYLYHRITKMSIHGFYHRNIAPNGFDYLVGTGYQFTNPPTEIAEYLDKLMLLQI